MGNHRYTCMLLYEGYYYVISVTYTWHCKVIRRGAVSPNTYKEDLTLGTCYCIVKKEFLGMNDPNVAERPGR
jgi:hypothetical protein